MDNQLGLLISTYEDEVKLLERQLNYCLWEGDVDYVSAYRCKKALEYTKGKLYELKLLDDPLYDKKLWQQQIIDGYEKNVDNANTDHLKVYYTEKSLVAKQELERLNKLPKPDDVVKHLLLNELLHKLLDRKLKNLKLVFRKENKLELAFHYSGKRLRVIFPHARQHLKSSYLYSNSIDVFEELGFIWEEKLNRLILLLKGEKQSLMDQLQVILPRIAFNILYCRQFAKESYVQYSE